MNNPFSNRKQDLGIADLTGYDKVGIDSMLEQSAYTNDPKCCVCSSTNIEYQVVAKSSKFMTAELQNGVYICKHCLAQEPLDKNIYGVKPL